MNVRQKPRRYGKYRGWPQRNSGWLCPRRDLVSDLAETARNADLKMASWPQAAATFLLLDSSTIVLRIFLQAEASMSAASMASLAIWAADLVYSDLYFIADTVRDSSSCMQQILKKKFKKNFSFSYPDYVLILLYLFNHLNFEGWFIHTDEKKHKGTEDRWERWRERNGTVLADGGMGEALVPTTGKSGFAQ